MNYKESTWIGPLPRSKNVAHSCWNTCSIMLPPCVREASEALRRIHTRDSQVRPWTSLLGSPDEEILEVAEHVYREELAVVPSVLPHQWHDRCMRELWWKLHRLMARASLPIEIRMAWTSSRSRRCLCSHSTSRACSPSCRHGGMEAAKKLKEDASAGQPEVRRYSHSRGRNRSRQHQSPSPQYPSKHQSPSPSHPLSLSCSMKNLHFYTRLHKSRSRVWQNDAPTPGEYQRNKLGSTRKETWVMTPHCLQT